MSDASKINDGIPAFPQNEFSAYTLDRAGLTKRDYFAAAALTGLLAYNEAHLNCGTAPQAAAAAFELADAMITASKSEAHHG